MCIYTIPFHNSSRIVLKKGFVKLVDCMPRNVPLDSRKLMCDSAVVQAARVSYGQGLKNYDTDSKLINFLYKHQHTSPFEMVKFKFHVKAPIFVARQWFRHRMANYNEISGRYSELKNEFYIPDKVSSQSKINKQLSSNDDVSKDEKIKGLLENVQILSELQLENYKNLMKEGVSREIARIHLPLSLFTEFYFSIDLHNLLNFIKLRNADNAQYEIREYASAIHNIIKPLCPVTIKAFDDNIKVTLSKDQLKALDIFEFKFSNLTTREQNELNKLLGKYIM